MKTIYFDSLPSTNDYLKDNFYEYNDEDVIVAITQTAGRGRFKREWISNNDLTFSILFKNTKYNHSIIAPLAIIYTLKKYSINAKIKWPNDIYLNNHKLSGILIESMYTADIKECEIVGIGINTSKKDDSLNSTFISIDNNTLLNDLLYTYTNLLNMDPILLFNEYKKYSMVLNMNIRYNNGIYKIVDFTDNLELILENDNHKLILNANEIDIKHAIIKKEEN